MYNLKICMNHFVIVIQLMMSNIQENCVKNGISKYRN